MQQYDAYQFVQSIRSKYWLGMLSAIDSALITAARRPTAYRRGSSVRPGSDADFMRFLIAARDYLLSEGRVRPEALDQDQFLLLKPLCEHLVRTGRFPYARLKLFEGLEAWRVGELPDAGTTEQKDRP